jgi:hypothetical protein
MFNTEAFFSEYFQSVLDWIDAEPSMYRKHLEHNMEGLIAYRKHLEHNT